MKVDEMKTTVCVYREIPCVLFGIWVTSSESSYMAGVGGAVAIIPKDSRVRSRSPGPASRNHRIASTGLLEVMKDVRWSFRIPDWQS